MWPIPRVWALINTPSEFSGRPATATAAWCEVCHRDIQMGIHVQKPWQGHDHLPYRGWDWMVICKGWSTKLRQLMFYFHWKRLVFAWQKNNIALDHVMFLGNVAFLRAHNKPFCWFFGVFFLKKNNTLETLGRLNPDIWDGQIWMFGISDPWMILAD